MSYDATTIVTLRRVLDEVVRDRRFSHHRSASVLEVAEHLLMLAAAGERDLEKLKSSALTKVTANAEQLPTRAA
jgi:hypothetical protein